MSETAVITAILKKGVEPNKWLSVNSVRPLFVRERLVRTRWTGGFAGSHLPPTRPMKRSARTNWSRAKKCNKAPAMYRAKRQQGLTGLVNGTRVAAVE